MVEPARFPQPRHWLAAASIIVVVLLVVMDLDSATPGPLAPVHARIPELDGVAGCEECHDPETGRVDCSGCHEPIEEDLAASRGLHGALEAERAADCGHCHLEHLDGEPPLVADFSFERSGYPTRAGYDHAGLAFDSSGAHASTNCLDCHEHADDDVLADGVARFRGAPTECTACHDDPHEGSLPDCADCHAPTRGFAEFAGYQHDPRWPLVGEHARVGCVECHDPDGPDAVGKVQGRPPSEWRDCDACHDSPHREAFLTELGRLTAFRAPARAAELPSGGRCAPCHAAADEGFGLLALARFELGRDAGALGGAAPESLGDAAGAGAFSGALADSTGALAAEGESPVSDERASGSDTPRAGLVRATASSWRDAQQWHAASGFALTAPHAELGCGACHDPESGLEPTFDTRFPGRDSNRCAACHEDPHAGQFVDDAGRASDCLECHRADAFEPHLFDLARHAETALPLEESHAAVRCDECHTELGTAGERMFVGLSADCASCHEDVHDFPTVEERHADGQACEQCHRPSTFADGARDDFDHGLWTAFALELSHSGATCESCHEPTREPDPHGRRFGRVVASEDHLAGDCENCHQDVHRGRFDALPSFFLLGEGRRARDCERCHDARDFSMTHDFDHDRDTGFALLGEHAPLDCELCHLPSESADEFGRSFGWIEPDAERPYEGCLSCHADPHEGRFDRRGRPREVEGRTGCARCHGEEGFDRLRGVTAAMLPFALEGAEDAPAGGELAPSGAPAADALDALASRPLSIDLRFAGFDHDRWTDHALVGAHAAIACSPCHAEPEPTPGGGWTRMGAARGRECASCHEDVHGGQFRDSRGRTDCTKCHGEERGDFESPFFDHARDSRFALDELHEDLDCDACHRRSRTKDGRVLVRYKPLGVECIDCHRGGVPGESGGKGGRR